MAMQAKYVGKCATCGSRIEKGAWMSYKNRQARHFPACPDNQSQDAPKQLPKVGEFPRKHFTSSAIYAEWCQERDQDGSLLRITWGHDDEYGSKALAGVGSIEHGNPDAVAAIQKVVYKLSEQITTSRDYWGHSVAGAFPDVPAFLAGEPESMFLRQHEDSDRTPIRIWVGLSSSIGIGSEQLTRRGATLAAFAIALSEHRPVQITPYVLMGTYSRGFGAVLSWDIQTSPFVLSELASIADPNVTRHLGIQVCRAINPECTGDWPNGYNDESTMRQVLGAAEQDIWLNCIHLEDPLLTDPDKWIRDNLAKYVQEQ